MLESQKVKTLLKRVIQTGRNPKKSRFINI